MLPPDLIGAVAALFIVAMVWVRTRIHYARQARGARALTRAGTLYFAAIVLSLVLGWFAAPALAAQLASGAPPPPLLARVVWFLATYYLAIPAHRALRSHGVALFKTPVADMQGPR
jgi:hypothetical protein